MNEILDMAKAHLQNVALKIEELKNQEKNIQNEIEKLSHYLNNSFSVLDNYIKTQTNS